MKKTVLTTLFLAILLLTACCRREGKPSGSETPPEPAAGMAQGCDGLDALSPEEQFILVEQAVDSWMYFHLLDYSSYTPLIRSTDYDAGRDVHIHHVRYRAANAMGGLETHEKTFEVRLKVTSGRLTDYDVKDVTGSPNATETPEQEGERRD